MNSVDPFAFLRDKDAPPAGPLILGVPWPAPPLLVRTVAELAAGLEVHLACAFVDPASYLTEWEPARMLSAASLDLASNDEAAYPSDDILASLEEILGNHRASP